MFGLILEVIMEYLHTLGNIAVLVLVLVVGAVVAIQGNNMLHIGGDYGY